MCRYISFLNFTIPLYGLMMCIGVFLSCFLMIKRAKKMGVALDDMIFIMALSVGAAIVVGGLFYILITFSPRQIWGFVRSGDFSFVKNAGLVFYGGLAGGIIGAVAGLRIMNISPEKLEMIAVPYLPLGHAVGRIGCLFAGCCYGIEYDGFFAVKNVYALNPDTTYFPIQAVEALFNIAIMCVLLITAKKKREKYMLLALYLEMYAIVRFCMEFLRGDTVRGIRMGFSTSQWISVAIIVGCMCYKTVGRKIAKK